MWYKYLYTESAHITFTFMHLADAKATYSAFRLYIYLSVCVFPGNITHNLLRC